MNKQPLSEKLNQLIDKRIIEYIESPRVSELILTLIPVYNWPG